MTCETCLYKKQQMFDFPCVLCVHSDIDNNSNMYQSDEPIQLELWKKSKQ